MPIWHALPSDRVDSVGDWLRRRLGSVRLRPWTHCTEGGGVLLLAPHEYSATERMRICAAVPWAWVHLTSGGTDFIDQLNWPQETLLTRSWRCYATPLAEYATHAILTSEWQGALPWQLPDPRRSSGDGAPVPELGSVPARGLYGSRVGVAGWGEVGQRIGLVTRALGADVVVLRRAGTGAGTDGVTFTGDPRVVVDADHLVIALPLNDGTRGLFDAAVLSGARPGLHLVNVSRPQIVDQAVLQRLCAAGRMRATLDVTDPEPLPPHHPLRSLPSVRLSPHIAWRSRSSGDGYVDDFVALVAQLVKGDRPPARAWGGGDAERAIRAVRAMWECPGHGGGRGDEDQASRQGPSW